MGSPGPDTPAGPAAAAVSPSGGTPAARPGRPETGWPPRSEAAGAAAGGSGLPAARMTARGAVLAMFSLFFPGTLTAGWLHLGVLTGLSFVAGCTLTARYTRRDGLLTVAVTPPLIFLISLVCAEMFTSHADTIRHALTSAAEGTILTLAGVAPWLFAGVLISLVITMFRGLPQCVHDLREELRGDVGLPAPNPPREPPGGSRWR
ncbi:MAG TPA: DUF6542 domain-containing protein [Streptosporangiaceae bacterium]|nr:DUF6542 domain-containing protein [Streptosporangiaceae bacterium]